jgi:phage baseplate assembly protein W
MKSVKLPFKKGLQGYFELNSSLSEVYLQKIRVLINTEEESRIMENDYGAGLRKFLFEPNDQFTELRMKNFLKDKFTRYIPELKIQDLIILKDENQIDVEMFFLLDEKTEKLKFRITQ